MAEYNLVQAPELIRRMARRLGIRQQHITPTLNEGVQAIVLLDDMTQQQSETQLYAMGTGDGTAPDGVSLFSSVGLFNPLGSGIKARVTNIRAGYISTLNSAILGQLCLGRPAAGLPAGFTSSGGAKGFTDRTQTSAPSMGFTVTQLIRGRAIDALGAGPMAVICQLSPVGPLLGQKWQYPEIRLPQLWLAPGDLLVFQTPSILVGDILSPCSFQWYEEPLT